MLITAVGSARPNFMKLAPIVAALSERGAEVAFIHAGQHYDARMSGVFLRELGLPDPVRVLSTGSASHGTQTGRAMEAFEAVLLSVPTDVVLVVGDVNSTLACALVAAKAGCLVAHVEAGLRSRDWSMPEEVNRVVTDRVSDFLLAPSPDAVENLRREGYREDQIHLVGNVMIDTLLANVDRARERPILSELGVAPGGYGLVTLHRPANVDDPDVLSGILRALRVIARDCPLVFPVHPRTRGRLDGEAGPGIILTEPAGYLDFIALQAGARVVLTDSGGVQEETTVLGVPCLTLRDNTERPITVTEGTNRVIGRNPERIVAEAQRVLRDGVEPRRPALWDGRAGERIADVIVNGADAQRHRRPTALA